MSRNVEQGAKRIALPEDFSLPTPSDLDAVVETIDDRIKVAGGPGTYIGAIRTTRASWQSMQWGVLEPLSSRAFSYEAPLLSGKPPKTDLRIARAALSGMLFGHMANEEVYPEMLRVVPYNASPINPHFIPGEHDFDELWKRDREGAYRLGVQAMADLFTHSLDERSAAKVASWGDAMVGEDRVHHFTTGFGIALYHAWDAYSDFMMEEGRQEAVAQYVQTHLRAS